MAKQIAKKKTKKQPEQRICQECGKVIIGEDAWNVSSGRQLLANECVCNECVKVNHPELSSLFIETKAELNAKKENTMGKDAIRAKKAIVGLIQAIRISKEPLRSVPVSFGWDSVSEAIRDERKATAYSFPGAEYAKGKMIAFFPYGKGFYRLTLYHCGGDYELELYKMSATDWKKEMRDCGIEI